MLSLSLVQNAAVVHRSRVSLEGSFVEHYRQGTSGIVQCGCSACLEFKLLCIMIDNCVARPSCTPFLCLLICKVVIILHTVIAKLSEFTCGVLLALCFTE